MERYVISSSYHELIIPNSALAMTLGIALGTMYVAEELNLGQSHSRYLPYTITLCLAQINIFLKAQMYRILV